MLENINKDKTFSIYGYQVEQLLPCSCKLVIWNCKNCNLEIIKKFRDAKRHTLCLKCSNNVNSKTNIEKRSENVKRNWAINGHPRLGEKHRQESKEKISSTRLKRDIKCSEETKAKLRLATNGQKNPFYGKTHTPETLSKLSAIHKNISKKGKDCNLYGKCYHPKIIKYKGMNLRSTWEFKLIKYFESKNIEYSYEPQTFDLIINSVECSYTPDFYLPKEDKYIEVKGYWRGDAKLKYENFLSQYPHITIELYQRKELKNLGIRLYTKEKEMEWK